MGKVPPVSMRALVADPGAWILHAGSMVSRFSCRSPGLPEARMRADPSASTGEATFGSWWDVLPESAQEGHRVLLPQLAAGHMLLCASFSSSTSAPRGLSPSSLARRWLGPVSVDVP